MYKKILLHQTAAKDKVSFVLPNIHVYNVQDIAYIQQFHVFNRITTGKQFGQTGLRVQPAISVETSQGALKPILRCLERIP